MVKFLLKDTRVDPSDVDNAAIRYASDSGHFDIVKLLLDDERIDLSMCDFLPASHDSKLALIDILLSNKLWFSKIDPEKLIITLLKNDKDIAAFVVSKINIDTLTDKVVIEFANEHIQKKSHTDIINIMKKAGITNIHVKIGVTETKITEVVHKDGKNELITTHIK